MLFLDGMYVERHDGSLWFRWMTAPTIAELARLTQAMALRIGRYLERQGLLERDAQNCYLAGDDLNSFRPYFPVYDFNNLFATIFVENKKQQSDRVIPR